MEWLRKLRGAIVGLDTAPLIYFVEESPLYLPLVDKFFEAMADGDFQVVTSTVALCEVLVHPYREGDQILAAEYFKILLHAKNLQVIPVTARIAAEAARLRAVHGMKAPDALQLATAQSASATAFLTNDKGFANIAGLNVVRLDDVLSQSRF